MTTQSTLINTEKNPTNQGLTKSFEGMYYDMFCYAQKKDRVLAELFSDLPKLLPKQPVVNLPHYRVVGDQLVAVESSAFDFTDEIAELERVYPDEFALHYRANHCFVLEFDADVFTGKDRPTAYLIDLEADFVHWLEAIIVRSDSEGLVIDHVSDTSDFLSAVFFKRFFINFPSFLIEQGVKAAYPVLAKKSLSK